MREHSAGSRISQAAVSRPQSGHVLKSAHFPKCCAPAPSGLVRVSAGEPPPFMAFWYYGFMATRKMTFSVPEQLAVQLLRRVASRDRSRFVSEAVAARLEERDAALIRACEIANQDMDVAEIEKELDGLSDEMAEPWR